jgi:hypothetical protein
MQPLLTQDEPPLSPDDNPAFEPSTVSSSFSSVEASGEPDAFPLDGSPQPSPAPLETLAPSLPSDVEPRGAGLGLRFRRRV